MAQNPLSSPFDYAIIGGSSGSLEPLITILSMLDFDFDLPLIIVFHRSSNASDSLAHLLAAKTFLQVKEADEKEIIKNGFVYLAPPDYHLLIEKNGSFSLDFSEKVKYSRPSIDVSFKSAADVAKNRLIAILLSGANEDGAAGIAYIKSLGGTAIIQDPAEAMFSYMPLQAISKTTVDGILSAQHIGHYLNKINNDNLNFLK